MRRSLRLHGALCGCAVQRNAVLEASYGMVPHHMSVLRCCMLCVINLMIRYIFEQFCLFHAFRAFWLDVETTFGRLTISHAWDDFN